MIYTDISATDKTFLKFTSFEEYNSTMNFFIGTEADINLNDNEYIRIRAYSLNENLELTHN